MNHVAIDLGGRESQICIRSSDGTIVGEKKHFTRKLDELFRTWPRSRVIVETSSESFRIADAAQAAGHEVRVVPATLVKQLGVGARGVKNDERDARTLSEVSCRIDLPSVHIPSSQSRMVKSICGSREILIETRAKLIHHVRGWLRTQLWRIRTGATNTFPDRVRGQAVTHQTPLPDHIESVLQAIEALTPQIVAADKRVERIAKEQPVCRRLMTTPGVGPVTAVRFLAAVDSITRFPNAHALQSYLGVTPGESSSSERQQRTGITKAGPAPLRRTLIQAAWTAFFKAPKEPMVVWAHQVAARRGQFIAVVALARKIVGILFALWRDGTSYRSSMSAQTPAA